MFIELMVTLSHAMYTYTYCIHVCSVNILEIYNSCYNQVCVVEIGI